MTEKVQKGQLVVDHGRSGALWERLVGKACGKGPEPPCWDGLEPTKGREVDAFLAERQREMSRRVVEAVPGTNHPVGGLEGSAAGQAAGVSVSGIGAIALLEEEENRSVVVDRFDGFCEQPHLDPGRVSLIHGRYTKVVVRKVVVKAKECPWGLT